MRILFIGKKNDFYCNLAAEFVKRHFPEHLIELGERSDPLAEGLGWWEPDYVISYLSPWIIPSYLLEDKIAINFHTGPPEYPGIGCTNFAIYEGAKTYGITCHKMSEKVDTGQIIKVVRFPLYESDTVFSLTQRCYAHILTLFYEMMDIILTGKKLPNSAETWTRKPFTRKELDELCVITKEMPDAEVIRRVRAVSYPNMPGAYIKIKNLEFKI